VSQYPGPCHFIIFLHPTLHQVYSYFSIDVPCCLVHTFSFSFSTLQFVYLHFGRLASNVLRQWLRNVFWLMRPFIHSHVLSQVHRLHYGTLSKTWHENCKWYEGKGMWKKPSPVYYEVVLGPKWREWWISKLFVVWPVFWLPWNWHMYAKTHYNTCCYLWLYFHYIHSDVDKMLCN